MAAAAAEKESVSVPLSRDEEADLEDPVKSPPSSPNSSTRKACCAFLQSWVSRKFMTGIVVLFPVAITFFITWWFIQFVDGFFSPLYRQLGVDIFGLGFLTSLIFVFLVGIFVSSWLGASVFWLGEWVIKKMPLMRHIYSASKQISTAISPVSHFNMHYGTPTKPRKNKIGAISKYNGIQGSSYNTPSACGGTDKGDEELCSVFVPTNHLYIGDIFLVNSSDVIRPNLSIREGIEIIVSGGMTMPQTIAPLESISRTSQSVQLNRISSC
ncbi:Protein LIKE COV 2 [Carex littledalei]|uniref:Protein LIKE COV 2 n=1 Tax=Carex littledalei TaxID=544730 RepID=A0A833VRB7_9POAL|nr:Protein LIKE COV 2 [Carex littledalei]